MLRSGGRNEIEGRDPSDQSRIVLEAAIGRSEIVNVINSQFRRAYSVKNLPIWSEQFACKA